MEVNYIRPFDSWIDGSLSIAKKIVGVFENSQDFSLTEYEGQEDFYEEYISKYDDFVSLLGVVEERKAVTLEAIRAHLIDLSERGRLTFAHFLLSYYQVLFYLDQEKGRREVAYFPVLEGRDVASVMDEYACKNQRIVPFTSVTGAFGYNTFFYMFYHGVLAVACSAEPYPVHGGTFLSSTATLAHDYAHARTTDVSGNGARLRDVYFQLIQHYQEGLITADTTKLLIVLMFRYVHEIDRVFSCSNKYQHGALFDEVPLLLRLPEYAPERYGFSTDVITNGNESERIAESVLFARAAFNEGEDILCREFGFLLN